MNTRRYPRTLQQAFGPYTDNRIEPMPTPHKPLTLAQIIYIPTLVAVLGCLLIF